MKIQPNRTTICIMNLWAKRIGQLALLPVALFFFCCEDEANLLGYRNPNNKFDARFVEIPIESSVLLLDSQRTSNFIFQNETNRLLVGQYNDEKLGNLTASAFTQFYTNTTAKLPAGATFDSISLTLILDKYNYGSRDISTQQGISVYELDDSLRATNRFNYFSKSDVPVKPLALGSKTFVVNPDSLDYYTGSRANDSTFTVRLSLDAAFGQRIFDTALLWRDYDTTEDSTYTTYNKFVQLFKGIAIKSDVGDKVIGINPGSFLSLHYHTPSDTSQQNLGFFGLANFSQIKGDLGSTELSGIQYSQDFLPADDMRYIQSGTGIFTKLDFGNFFQFADTIENVIITSAQLVIDPVSDPGKLTPPASYALRLLSNNYVERYSRKNTQDNNDFLFYNPTFAAHPGTLRVDAGTTTLIEPDSSIYVNGDTSPLMRYDSEDKVISGNFALFFQQLAMVREDKRRFQYFLMHPSAPSSPNTKSVNRVVFPKDNIKLRIYYTKPTTPLN